MNESTLTNFATRHWDKAWHALCCCFGFTSGYHLTGHRYNHIVALSVLAIGILWEFAYKWASHKWDGKVWEIDFGIFVIRHEWKAEDVDWWDVVADAIGILMPYSLTW